MHRTKEYKWYKIADAVNELVFNEANLLEMKVGGKHVCIAKGRNGFYGCTATCPHAGGILCEGFIDALDNIVCPLHRYRFSLANGRNISGEGYYLKTYPVEIREDGVYLGIEQGGIFSALGF